MKNDINNFGKRTASQVGAVLKSIGIQTKPENMGDGRTFTIGVESTLKNRVALKKAGFLLCMGNEGDKYITFKAF